MYVYTLPEHQIDPVVLVLHKAVYKEGIYILSQSTRLFDTSLVLAQLFPTVTLWLSWRNACPNTSHSRTLSTSHREIGGMHVFNTSHREIGGMHVQIQAIVGHLVHPKYKP